ncbi:MAG: glycosyltransferase family 39 protein [Planctomycetaceae bacterium]
MDVGNQRRGLLLCLALAGLVRLSACWQFSHHLTDDLDAYVGIALSISDGRGYSSPGTNTPTAYRPPLFPLLLAPLIPLVGVTWGVALLQCSLGIATVYLTWKLGVALRLRIGAFIAAALVAVDPILLHYGTYPMTEVCCACLMTAWLLCVVRAESDSNLTMGAVRRFASGVLFGLAALCRPTVWMTGAVYAGYWSIRKIYECSNARRVSRDRVSIDDDSTFSDRLRHCAPILELCGVICIAGPWVIRNQLVLDSPILTTTHGGYTLLLANNPTFYREVVDRPWGAYWEEKSLLNWQSELEQQIGRASPPVATETERDRWMYQEAYRTIQDEPTTFLKACGKRFLWFWNLTPMTSSEASLPASLFVLIAVYYGVVTCLMLIGLFRFGISVAHRIRRGSLALTDGGEPASNGFISPAWVLILMPIFTFTAAHLVYWTNMRMRGPVVPMIALLAALACVKPGLTADPTPQETST